MSQPRIFVSYSRKDSVFTQRLVNDLHGAGAEVWVDVAGIQHGNFMERIDDALAQCEWMVLVLTPNAIASQYVRDEVYAALHRVKQGFMRDVIPILAMSCPVGDIPPTWDVLHRLDATNDYESALNGVITALGLPVRDSLRDSFGARTEASPIPTPPGTFSPLAPGERFPPHLAKLGYAGRIVGGTEVIIPPVSTIPAGEFLMGSDSAQDKHAKRNEQPQHRLTLPGFQIARFPVTVAEYACFVRAGGMRPKYPHPHLSDDSEETWIALATTVAELAILAAASPWQKQLKRLEHPVVDINWYSAKAYAVWLSAQTGEVWRLPTEAEWEKAARWNALAHKSQLYPWGDTFEKSRCSLWRPLASSTAPVGTHPSGASPCGAQDMVGAIPEWTSSLFKPYPYRNDDGREDAGWEGARVVRGGVGWLTASRDARAAARTGRAMESEETPTATGFRLVRIIPGL